MLARALGRKTSNEIGTVVAVPCEVRAVLLVKMHISLLHPAVTNGLPPSLPSSPPVVNGRLLPS